MRHTLCWALWYTIQENVEQNAEFRTIQGWTVNDPNFGIMYCHWSAFQYLMAWMAQWKTNIRLNLTKILQRWYSQTLPSFSIVVHLLPSAVQRLSSPAVVLLDNTLFFLDSCSVTAWAVFPTRCPCLTASRYTKCWPPHVEQLTWQQSDGRLRGIQIRVSILDLPWCQLDFHMGLGWGLGSRWNRIRFGLIQAEKPKPALLAGWMISDLTFSVQSDSKSADRMLIFWRIGRARRFNTSPSPINEQNS